MKNKETKKPKIEFKDDELSLRCDAGGHYMTVSYIIVDDELIDAWLSIQTMPRTVWDRVKLAWQALFSRKPFEINDMDIASSDKAEKLKAMIQKIQDVLRAYEERRGGERK